MILRPIKVGIEAVLSWQNEYIPVRPPSLKTFANQKMWPAKGFSAWPLCHLTGFLRIERKKKWSCWKTLFSAWPLCDLTRFSTFQFKCIKVLIKKRILMYYSKLMDLLFENGFSGWGQFLQSPHPEKLHCVATFWPTEISLKWQKKSFKTTL